MGRGARTQQSAWRKRALTLESKLSESERRFAVARAAGMKKREAALAAGYSHKSAHTRAYKLEARKHVQEYIGLLRKGVVTDAVLQTENVEALLRRNEEDEEFEQTLDRLEQELVVLDIDTIRADPGELYRVVDGVMIPKNFDQLNAKQRRRVTGYRYQFEPDGRTFLLLETRDFDKAVERISAYLGLRGKNARARVEQALGLDAADKPKHTAVPSKTTDRGLAKATANEIKAKVLGIDALPSDDEASALLAGTDEPSPAPSDETDDESDDNP